MYVIGVSAGEERQLNVKFPDDYPAEALKGREAVFEVKAQAVKAALEGPVTEACPASILRTQPNVKLYLDGVSTALVTLPD